MSGLPQQTFSQLLNSDFVGLTDNDASIIALLDVPDEEKETAKQDVLSNVNNLLHDIPEQLSQRSDAHEDAMKDDDVDEDEDVDDNQSVATFVDEDDFDELFGTNYNDEQLMGISMLQNLRKKRERYKVKNPISVGGAESAPKRRRSRKQKIPDDVRKLMQNANTMFVGSNYAGATKILLDVIRLKPNFPDPYQTLACIYEAMGQYKKALEFFMMAAFLQPRNASQWKQNVITSQQLGLTDQAIYCKERACRLEPTNYEQLYELCQMYESSRPFKPHNLRRCIEAYTTLVNAFPGESKFVTPLVRLYYENNMIDQALQVLKDTLEKTLQHLDPTVLNMCLELQVAKKMYQEGIQLVQRVSITSVMPFELLPIEIKVKYAICKTFIGDLESVESIFNEVIDMPNSARHYHDILFDIADTFYEMEEYERAIPIYIMLLSALTTTKEQGTLMIKIGECYNRVDNDEQAASFYASAIEKIPDHTEARLALAEIYRNMGQTQKALAALNDPYATVEELEVPNIDEIPPDEDIEMESPSSSDDDDSDPEYQPDEMEQDSDEGDAQIPLEDIDRAELDANPVTLPSSYFAAKGKHKRRINRHKRVRLSSGELVMRKYDDDVPTTFEEDRQHKMEEVQVIAKRAWIHYSTPPHDHAKFIEASTVLVESILELDLANGIDLQIEQEPSSTADRIMLRENHRGLTVVKRKKTFIRQPQKDTNWTWSEALHALGSDELFYFLLAYCRVLAAPEHIDPSDVEARKDATNKCLIILDKLLTSTKTTRKSFNFENVELRNRRMMQFRYLSVCCAYSNQEFHTAYEHIRPLLEDRPYSVALWNLMNKIFTRIGNVTKNRYYLVRMLSKFPQSVPLMILVANMCSIAGTYRLALAEYFRAYRSAPNDPLIVLCIAINYLSIVMNRRSANRHLLVMQSFTFFYRYFELCKEDDEKHSTWIREQEACYNLGRAYQQLGIYQFAIHYYERVLYMHDRSSRSIDEESNLAMDAAFNLCLIYRKTGGDEAYPKIRQIQNTYLTI
jgi:tetratricopeptide (TPR) repeat protein